jgi:three-Cys-motif partner protein
MSNQSFFEERKEQSIIKSKIVEKYFWAWSKIIIPRLKQRERERREEQNLAYIDLFAGPGRYKDGSESTPLQILETALQDADLRDRLLTIFNDLDSNNTNSLQTCIESIPNIERLRHKSIVRNQEIGESIIREFESMQSVPTLFFIDPWGYKGLSLRLINSAIKNWGCDCIFFFNYNRINMGLNNPSVREHMNALFGRSRADALREKIQPMKPIDKELNIVEEICEALQEMGARYVLPFCFKNNSGNRTSHHLIFVSKNERAYSIMKDIMAKESSTTEQGVPSFEYNPATQYQPFLFEISRPLDELEDMLLDEFAGQTLTMAEVYKRHHVGKRYIDKNYKTALKNLEQQGKIVTNPPSSKRRKNTMAATVRITFPRK